MLTPHQKEQLQKNFKDNQLFFQMYGQELAMKRQIREKCLEFAMKMKFVSNAERNAVGQPDQPRVTPPEIFLIAEEAFKFITSDGDLDGLAQKPVVEIVK